MTSRQLYAEQKAKLCDRVVSNVGTFAQIANSIGKGGRADQALKHSIEKFANSEHQIEETAANLKKLELLHVHMTYQFENIEKNSALLENLKEQAQSMRR